MALQRMMARNRQSANALTYSIIGSRIFEIEATRRLADMNAQVAERRGTYRSRLADLQNQAEVIRRANRSRNARIEQQMGTGIISGQQMQSSLSSMYPNRQPGESMDAMDTSRVGLDSISRTVNAEAAEASLAEANSFAEGGEGIPGDVEQMLQAEDQTQEVMAQYETPSASGRGFVGEGNVETPYSVISQKTLGKVVRFQAAQTPGLSAIPAEGDTNQAMASLTGIDLEGEFDEEEDPDNDETEVENEHGELPEEDNIEESTANMNQAGENLDDSVYDQQQFDLIQAKITKEKNQFNNFLNRHNARVAKIASAPMEQALFNAGKTNEIATGISNLVRASYTALDFQDSMNRAGIPMNRQDGNGVMIPMYEMHRQNIEGQGNETTLQRNFDMDASHRFTNAQLLDDDKMLQGLPVYHLYGQQSTTRMTNLPPLAKGSSRNTDGLAAMKTKITHMVDPKPITIQDLYPDSRSMVGMNQLYKDVFETGPVDTSLDDTVY